MYIINKLIMQCGQYKFTPLSFMYILAATIVQIVIYIGQTHDNLAIIVLCINY